MDDRTPIPMAYEGDPDCTSLMCRRFMGADGSYPPGCIGWHCYVCREPSSQYGHPECRDTPVNP